MYSFRQVDSDDEEIVELLTELHLLTFGPDCPISDFDYGTWWIGTDGREAMSFCGLTQSTYHPSYAYLKRVGVLPGHRGQGLQRRMITMREKRARLLGFTHCITDTTDNPASANSLIAAGYRMFEPEEGWSFPTALYWKKEL